MLLLLLHGPPPLDRWGRDDMARYIHHGAYAPGLAMPELAPTTLFLTWHRWGRLLG